VAKEQFHEKEMLEVRDKELRVTLMSYVESYLHDKRMNSIFIPW